MNLLPRSVLILLPLAVIVGACATVPNPITPGGRFVLEFNEANNIPGLSLRKLERALQKYPPRPGSQLSYQGKRMLLNRTADAGEGLTIAQQTTDTGSDTSKPTPTPSPGGGEGPDAIHVAQRVVYDNLRSLKGFIEEID